jgi:hypothetical protein
MKGHRILVGLIISSSVLVLLTAAAGLTLQYLFNGKVRDLFISELNKQLATEVKVDDIKLSLFQGFPYASVRFSGVQVKEGVAGKSKNNLLQAGLISLKFNVPDLLRNRFSVHFISISNAEFRLHYFADGSDNFHILKPSSGAKSEQFELNVQRINFSDTKFTYLDDAAHQQAKLNIKHLLLKGRFRNESFRMNASGILFVDQYASGNVIYIDKREISLNADLDINTRKGLYSVSKGEFVLEKLHLNTNGWVINRSDRKEMNLSVSSFQTPAKQVISLLPEKFRKQLHNYSIAGTGDISLIIRGLWGSGHMPSVTANITLDKGNLIHRKTSVGLQDLSFSGKYVSSLDGKGFNLNVNNLKATLRNGSINGSISMQGFESPVIKANLLGSFNLADIKEFLNSDSITQLSGMMSVTGVFTGQIANIRQPAASDFRNSRFSGSCTLNDVTVGLKSYNVPVTGLSGTISFNNNDLIVNTLVGKFGESDFKIKGLVGNLLSKIFVKGEILNINGSLLSEKTNWDEISSSSNGEGEYNFGIPGDIEIGELRVDVRNFHIRKFDAKNVTTIISIHNRILIASNILLQSMQGTVTGKATINATSLSHSSLTCQAKINKLNINRLFVEFGNFGSTDLIAENLDGMVTGSIIFSGMMFPNLDMDLQSIKSHAELMIEDGRLVNYAPMMDLSAFLRVEDLKDIRFETLTNQIDIANQIIYIPVMNIKSSALDLSVMGTHSFDNAMNYHFSIALADILASKFRKRNPGYNKQEEFGPVAEDGRGRTMVYVSMGGTVDEPVFSYDKKAVRQKITSEMQTQRSELKQVLNKEFQWIEGDSTKRAKTQKDKEVQKKQEEGKFVIEWDDDGGK